MKNNLSRLYYVIGMMVLATLLFPLPLQGQKHMPVYEQYISNYKGLAVEHMVKYKIPASITLAQGLLESGAGKGKLAQDGNNHFGIKCHSGWNGGRIYKDDDLKDECFRKYKRVEDSFDDHSRFLTDRSRYQGLFKLKREDYKAWARELQSSGYATDRAYANKLIKLIENYELYEFDNLDNAKANASSSAKKNNQVVIVNRHIPYKTQGLVYIVAKDGDSYESIAKEFDFKAKKLYAYNEIPVGFPLNDGDIVYFQKKRAKALSPYYEHIIKVGESMHSISQRYGMNVKGLYKLNKKDSEYIPTEGDILRLR